jgi:hypothetical protein
MWPNPFFCQKIMHQFYRGKSGPKLWATVVIFKRLPIENNHPKGENSLNLVTLLRTGKVHIQTS